jgi:hypothetical protein
MKKFFLYQFRWQLSTPILAIVVQNTAHLGFWTSAVIANIIGASIFFWVDRWIFRNKEGG